MNDASSDARKSAADAISSAFPSLPMGCNLFSISLVSASEVRFLVKFVSKNHGQRQFTLMFSPARSVAKVLVN